MTLHPLRSLLAVVLLSFCACGVPLPEEENDERVASSTAAVNESPVPPKAPTPPDPCITACNSIADQIARDSCILRCIIKNFR